MKRIKLKFQFPKKPSVFGILFVSFLLLSFLPLLTIHLIENQSVGKYERSLSTDIPEFINDMKNSEIESSLKEMGSNMEFSFHNANRALQSVCAIYPFWEEMALSLSQAPTEINSKSVIIFSTKLTKLLYSIHSLSEYVKAFAIFNQNNEMLAGKSVKGQILKTLPFRKILVSLPDSSSAGTKENGVYWVDLSNFSADFSGYLLAAKTFKINNEKNHATLVFDLKALLEKITPVQKDTSSSFFILNPLGKSVIVFSRSKIGKFNWRQFSLNSAKSDEKNIFQTILKSNNDSFSSQNNRSVMFSRKLGFNSWHLGFLSNLNGYYLPIEAEWKTYDSLRKKYLQEFRYFLFFVVILILTISVLLARYFQQPLQKFIYAIQKMKDGDIRQEIPTGFIREYSQLAGAFNEMSKKLHKSLQELSQSEKRYRSLIENAGEAIFVFSSDGKILMANNACSTLLEISPTELKQKNVAEIFKTLPFLEYTVKKQTNDPLELSYRKPGGKLLRLQIIITKLNLHENEIYQAIIHNLTPQKEFEEKLVEQNRFLSLTNAITGLVLSRGTLEDIYQNSLHLLMEMKNAILGMIYLFNPSSETFSLVYSLGVDEEFIEKVKFMDKHSLTYEVIRYKKTIEFNDILSDSRLSPNYDRKYFKKTGVQAYIGIPLLFEEIPFGVISLGLQRKAVLDEEEKRFLRSIGTQIGLVIRHFTSMQLETKRATQLALLSHGLEIWIETGNFNEVLQKSVDFIHENMGYWHVSVFLLDKEKNRFKLGAIAGGLRDLMKDDYIQQLGKGIISQVIQSKQTYYAPNAEKDPYYFKFGDFQAKSELAVPLRLHGEVIGVVNIEEMEYEAFDSVDISTIEAFSEQLAIYYEFENRIRLQKIHARQMELVSSLGALMNSKLDSTDFIRETVSGLRQKFGYFLVSVYLVSPEDENNLIKVADSGGTPSRWPIGKKVTIGQGLLGLAAKTKEIVCVNNVSKDSRFIPVGGALTGSELCVPIISRDKFLGVLNIETMNVDAFDEFEINAAQTLANQMAQAINNSQLFAQLKYEKEKMGQILSEMDEGVAMTNHQGEIVYLNSVFKNQFPTVQIGEDGNLVFPFSATLKNHTDYESLCSGKIKSLFVEFSYEGKVLLITVSQFIDFDFSKYFLFLVKNITEIKRYESEKIKSERLGLAVEMAGSIAHEINQPLTGILGYLALIKEDLEPDDALVSDLEEIENQAERISELVKKFQRVVKIKTMNYIGNSKIIDLEQSTQNSRGENS